MSPRSLTRWSCCVLLLALSSSVALAVCGDNVLDPGEQCDNGPSLGDCCDVACQYDVGGTPCLDDGAICTTDRCDGAGTCLHTPGPDPACGVPLVSGMGLVLLEPDRLSLRLLDDTAAASFGDPRNATTYGICVYDASANAQPLLAATIPANAQCARGRECWRIIITLGPSAYGYADPEGTYAGITRARLKEGYTRSLQTPSDDLVFRGRSPASAYPAPPFTPPVRVQVRASNGACWGAVYSAPTRNDPTQFKARPD